MKSPIPPRQRIITCALSEFSRHGYAGTATSRIARKARVSKRMLFYYFESKQRLFEAVLESAWENGEVLVSSPKANLEMMSFWSAFYLKNREWTKLLGWEGLEWKKTKGTLREKERRAYWEKTVGVVKASRAQGDRIQNLDVAYTLFGLIAMEMAPVLLPNLAHLILNEDTEDPTFQRKWIAFMRSFSEVLHRTDLAAKGA